LSWARDYFSAFLKSENAEEILLLWERISTLTETKKTKVKSGGSPPNNPQEVLALKSQIENSSVYASFKTDVVSDPSDWSQWSCEVQKRLHDQLLKQ